VRERKRQRYFGRDGKKDKRRKKEKYRDGQREG
jgi:hypothetical protein